MEVLPWDMFISTLQEVPAEEDPHQGIIDWKHGNLAMMLLDDRALNGRTVSGVLEFSLVNLWLFVIQ